MDHAEIASPSFPHGRRPVAEAPARIRRGLIFGPSPYEITITPSPSGRFVKPTPHQQAISAGMRRWWRRRKGERP